ncbi:MAG: M23 family metallopeptidase [Magnetococcales bacterium]|nr:M23 family metallopeptidase [Magnetococcales bacterium]
MPIAPRWAARLLIAAGLLLTTAIPHAWSADAPLSFALPVRCVMGEQCWIQNYPDRDPGPGAQDYRRGSLTYEGHRGVDFRVRTLGQMRQGVAVVAAADGRVKAIRDGMPDGPASGVIDRQAVGERCAGNGVVIDHGQGWESQYAHLRQGSVTVTPGQAVKAGEVLGAIGQSGMAPFPHVHFEVRRNGRFLDPFAAPDPGDPDRQTLSLWNAATLKQLPYQAAGELSSGFSATVPDDRRMADPPEESLDGRAEALIFWVQLFGARAGDLESMRLIAPSGAILARHEGRQKRHQARITRHLGKPRPNTLDSWPAGRYTGAYTLTRQGEEKPLVQIIRHLDIP